MNVSSGIERMARIYPGKTAIVSDCGRFSYGQLDTAANRVAQQLRDEYGVRPGDRVAIMAGNSTEFLVGFYGAIRAGGIAVPFLEDWTGPEIEARLNDCSPAVILVKPGKRIDDNGMARAIVEFDLADNALALNLISGNPPPTTDTIPYRQPGAAIAELISQSVLEPGRQDPFYIAYTSGSTGQPKGVLRHHGSWLDSYLAATIEFGLAADDTVFAPGPLFFSLSLFAVTHILFLGGTAYIMSRFDPRRALSVVEQERITALCMVPTLYEALLAVCGRHDLRSVKRLICAGASWPRADEAKRELLNLFPTAGLYEYYGAAEMSFVAISRPEDQLRRPRSVGKPFLGVQIEIRQDNGDLAKRGETGTLYARSSFGFQGYYGDAQRTATVLRDGWMTVGDLARTDEEGYLYIVGRKDNVVIVGGANVNVEEVEAVVAGYSKVAAAAVLGVDDAQRGQVLAALIQPRSGFQITVRELRQYCIGCLAPYKVPRKFIFVEALPVTATGKINRAELPQLFWEKKKDRRGLRDRGARRLARGRGDDRS